MTDDDLLASAYLDDEVTADERARVEADPELLAEVERLHSVRQQLAAPEPGSLSLREEHLASALAAWDRLPVAERLGTRDDTGGADAATVAAASAMSSFSTGRSRRRWLLGAAAALLVVVGAGVVLQQIDPADSDDDSDAVASEAASEEAPADEASSAEEATAEDVAEGASAEDLTAADIEAESQAIEEVEEEGGSTDELTHSADTPDAGPPGDDSLDQLPELTSQSDLIEFARPGLLVTGTTVPLDELADEETLSEATPTVPECPSYGIDIEMGAAYFGGQLVMVGVDRDNGLAIAYDLVGCDLVEALPIPD